MQEQRDSYRLLTGARPVSREPFNRAEGYPIPTLNTCRLQQCMERLDPHPNT
jgi:hypothetical protein